MTEEVGAAIHPGYPGVSIVAGGAMVAWFNDAEVAAEWASENHFGNWLMHPCVLPHVPPFSKEHIARAREEAERMHFLLGEPRIAED
jgi:hypothetical protein